MPMPIMLSALKPRPSAARTAPSTASSFRPYATQCLNCGFFVSAMFAALKAFSVSVFACGAAITFAFGKPAATSASVAPLVRSCAVGSCSW